jgi:hypothetical protein
MPHDRSPVPPDILGRVAPAARDDGSDVVGVACLFELFFITFVCWFLTFDSIRPLDLTKAN